MTLVARWWRFNLVGLLGFAVQMGAVAVLRLFVRRHDLWVSAAALEVTLLHNFLWHARYTWRDRRGDSRLRQLASFHLSNGLVSLAGNLAIVSLLTEHGHLPLLGANAIGVVCCAVANFYLGNAWAFATNGRARTSAKAESPIGLVGPPGLEPGTNGL